MEYKHKEGIYSMKIGTELIEKLPKHLQNSLKMKIYGEALKKIPALSKNFSEKFLNKVSLQMRE